MRRLAEELNVWPMSVYRYFHDKEELLEALMARLAEGVRTPDPDAPWRLQLRQLLTAYREVVEIDPVGLAPHTPRAFLAPSMLRLSEVALRILAGAGMEGADGARAWRALWSYAYGFTAFRIGGDRAESLRLTRVAIAGVPEDEFATLTQSAAGFTAAFATDDDFDDGLERLLDGLEASLSSVAPATP